MIISPPGQLNNGLEVSPPAAAGGGGSGTVTSIATTGPITGGTITGTGTIGITDFVASGASHARGAVPDPGAVAGTAKFLREDATWTTPVGIVVIGKVVTSGSAATITFSGIPATYTDLLLTFIGRDTLASLGDASALVQINGDTVSANYSPASYVLGNTISASSSTIPASSHGVPMLYCPGPNGNANAVGSAELRINNYAGTVFHKLMQTYGSESQTTNLFIAARGMIWKSTAAVTSIVLFAPGTAFVDGTTAVLYGCA